MFYLTCSWYFLCHYRTIDLLSHYGWVTFVTSSYWSKYLFCHLDKPLDCRKKCKMLPNLVSKKIFKNIPNMVAFYLNTLRPRQDGRYLPDDIFRCIFLNENVWIPLKISLEFVPKVPISNIPALVLITAWLRPGDKPLSEPMMFSLPTHICVTRPQWVNNTFFYDPKIFTLKNICHCVEQMVS